MSRALLPRNLLAPLRGRLRRRETSLFSWGGLRGGGRVKSGLTGSGRGEYGRL